MLGVKERVAADVYGDRIILYAGIKSRQMKSFHSGLQIGYVFLYFL